MNKKLKIINVHFLFSPYGGGEVVAYNTFKVLQKNGQDVYFFSSDKKPYFEENPEAEKYFYKFPEKKNGFINYLKRIPSVYYNKEAAQKFEKMLDDVKPDIVHVHTLGVLTYSILKPCFDRKVPVVKTEHSALIACPSESLFLKNETYCKKHLCVKGNYAHCIINKCCGKSVYANIVESLKNKICDMTGFNNKIARFISPSNALKEVIKEKGIPESKITVIPNFFDNKFKNLKALFEEGKYFLYSGRLYNFKGVKTLIEAINKLPTEISFHIAGTGPMEDELKKYCKENNLYNVKFLGFMKQEDLIEEYKNCIALVVPSTWFEIFGLIVIEAMALGKPVIASNIGALSEIINHNSTGLLFEPANEDSLKDCILKYWNNKDLALQHGQNAYKEANEKYTEDVYFKNIVNIYKEVLNKE